VTPVLTRVPVRLPVHAGQPYEAVVVIAEEAGLAGLGEAACIAGRPQPAALRAAEGCALLDLEARRRGVRLAELLGGVRRQSVECSALLSEPRAADVAARARALADQGYACFKLKAANAGGTVDQERAGAVRWAVGRGPQLRIDFNGRLDLDTALRRLPSLGAFGVEYFEQPLPAGAPMEAWVRLREAGVEVAVDESLADAEQAAELARRGFVLAAKVATVGGVEPLLALLRASAGAVTIGSSYESSIGVAAALHAACALPAEPLACGLATRGRLAGDLATGLDADGPRLALPSSPGLGVDLDPDALERYRVDR
jgi:L-alanine-DL-glutamate epimerase-like enolase superfamily enzyme